MDIRDIPLDKLHFGHEANPPLNARKVGREDDIETLTASIRSQGLGQTLLVREIAGTIYVADGNRRLAAMHRLVAEKAMPENLPVRCAFDDDTDAAELALALNIERVAMHDADVYEAFHRLQANGLREEDIAARFGIEAKTVRRMLALGKLHPKILDAWRANEIGLREVQKFTLAASLKEQELVFDRLKKARTLFSHYIQEALGISAGETKKLLNLVGIEDYVKAGGKVIEDLFGENHRVSDIDRLKKVATAKIEDEMKALRQQGWAWVDLEDNLPQGWRWNWSRERATPEFTKAEKDEVARLEKVLGDADRWSYTDEQEAAAQRLETLTAIADLRGFTSEQKNKSGVVVEIRDDGLLGILPGYVKPEDKKPASAEKKTDPNAPKISNAMMARLSVQFTEAAQTAIKADPHVALAALIAGIEHQTTYGYPVRVKLEGHGRYDPRPTIKGTFAETFKTHLGKSDSDLLKILAELASGMLDFTTQSNSKPPLGKDNAFLADALPIDALGTALRETFDAKAYFDGVARDVIVDAIREAINEDEARKAAKLKKKDLAAFAADNVPQTGWLPLELRTTHYDGPGARAKSKPKAAA